MYHSPKEHNPPHFHAYYQEHSAIIDIATCELIDGFLPSKQLNLLLLHRKVLFIFLDIPGKMIRITH